MNRRTAPATVISDARSDANIIVVARSEAEMAHQDEGGRSKNERREHDRKTRSYEETTGNPYHLSKVVRTVGGVLAVVVVIALTGLFVGGFIHW